MSESQVERLKTFLAGAQVAPEIFELRPEYRALLIVAHGITPGPSDDASETLLKAAESSARTELAKHPVTDIPHVSAWREAYKAFGAKPAKFRNSLEALTRRVTATAGLPRINRLTDIYNAISVMHQIPLGGEDLQKYSGPAQLIRATGKEDFETTDSGKMVVEHPDAGEVVWCDDVGVTCRRWNWRQGPRTALTDDTTSVLFILDALEPITDEALTAAADELMQALQRLGPDVRIISRIINASNC